MPNPGAVAIVGAGISGISCAQALRLAGVEVHLFERANRVGGRCATRLWQGHLVDYGIQYFTAQSADFKRELLSSLRQFRPLVAPLIDVDGKIIHSDEGPRFYVIQGNNYFAHVLAQGLDVRLNARVETVTFDKQGIGCMGETYRAVVSSIPAPQTAEIFQLNQAATEYKCCLSIILEYSGSGIGKSQEYYGFVLPENSEPLAASYCENHKSGRILGEKTVFVLQTAAQFSTAHADLEQGKNFIPELARLNEDLWEIPSGELTASFTRRWRLSRPDESARHTFELPRGAFICGDSRSKPTVEDVWLDGRRTAGEVLAFLAD